MFVFLQQRSHLQVKKLHEDSVGESRWIWMQASLYIRWTHVMAAQH